jgi:hypothetical protein
MAPQLLLNGRDVNGKQVRAGMNTADLLGGSKSNAFNKISQTLQNADSDFGRWSWSCSDTRGNTSYVLAVRLSDGYDAWDYKGFLHLGVLPFRFFREPHAVKAVNHLKI